MDLIKLPFSLLLILIKFYESILKKTKEETFCVLEAQFCIYYLRHFYGILPEILVCKDRGIIPRQRKDKDKSIYLSWGLNNRDWEYIDYWSTEQG